jgi:hypothetical protein
MNRSPRPASTISCRSRAAAPGAGGWRGGGVRVLAAGVVAARGRRCGRSKPKARPWKRSEPRKQSAIFCKVIFGAGQCVHPGGAESETRPGPKVRTALDRAAARISGKFGPQPGVEAAIRGTIGQTYLDLGLYADARKQLELALDYSSGSTGQQVRKPRDREPAWIARLFSGKYAGRATAWETLGRRSGEVAGPEIRELAFMNSLASVTTRRAARKRSARQPTVEIRRRLLVPTILTRCPP